MPLIYVFSLVKPLCGVCVCARACVRMFVAVGVCVFWYRFYFLFVCLFIDTFSIDIIMF